MSTTRQQLGAAFGVALTMAVHGGLSGSAPVSVTVQTSRGERYATVDQLLRTPDENSAVAELFRRGTDVVPDLARALSTPQIRTRTGKALAYIGDPDGLTALLAAIRAERARDVKVELSAYLAGSLVETKDPRYLAFLKQCMRTYRETDAEGPAASAALALGSAATMEARSILRIARPLDEEVLPEHEIAKAQRWTASGRVGTRTPGQPGSEDDAVKALVRANAFYAEGEETTLAVNAVIWTARRDKALVEVRVGSDPAAAREYHVVVARVSARPADLRIVGIWLNMVA